MSKRRPRSEHVRTYTPFVAEQSNHDQLAGVYSSLPFQFPAPLPREVEALVTVEHASTVEETAAAPPEITLPTAQDLGRIGSVNSRIRPTTLATVEISSTVEHTSTVEETAAIQQTFKKNSNVYGIRPDKISILNQGRRPKELSTSWVSLNSGVVYEAQRVQWVSIVQHSMTRGQESFYEAIWKSRSDFKFHISIIDRKRKQFRAGYDILARLTRLTDRRVQTMIPQLIEKQVLHSYKNADPNTRTGCAYDIFSYEEILSRQRAAGLCYVVKNGPGIEFVVPNDCSTVEVSSTVEQSSSVTAIGPKKAVEQTSTDENTSTGTVEESSRVTVEESSTPLDSRHSFLDNDVDGAVEKLEATILSSEFAQFDREAIRYIWNRSRDVVPDVTVEEVFHFFLEKAYLLGRNRRVQNFNGLMKYVWKEYFTLSRIEQVREQNRQSQQQELEYWQGILDNPDAPDELKEYAKVLLQSKQ